MGLVDIESAEVAVRSPDSGLPSSSSWSTASVDWMTEAQPWRTFRWYDGQRHYSGTYWAATEQRHVIYESRLELARLLFADFDSTVSRILAQPFLLAASVQGRSCRHVPDYLLLTSSVPVVVDVKPRGQLSNPAVRRVLDWSRELVEQRGWRYEVWSEPPEAVLENIRFLAGFRRRNLFAADLLGELESEDLVGRTLGEAFVLLPHRAPQFVRAALLSLLWRQRYTVDLDRPLCSATIIGAGDRDV